MFWCDDMNGVKPLENYVVIFEGVIWMLGCL